MIKTYKTCKHRKETIDNAFHQCVLLYANLGTDSTKTDRKNARAEEKRLLKSVRELDPEFLDPIIKVLD